MLVLYILTGHDLVIHACIYLSTYRLYTLCFNLYNVQYLRNKEGSFEIMYVTEFTK